MRVLLIEPDRVLAAAYQGALEQDGHVVDVVRSAQTAVHSADEAMPDVVVLEVQLPRHNGVEFLYEFRSYSEWQHVPVIIHSAVPAQELLGAVTLERELGVRQVLHKPATSLGRLRAVVQNVTQPA